MRNFAILYPMFALAAWTMVILLIIPVVRVRAALRREVRPNDFRFGESAAVPAQVSVPNRTYNYVIHRLAVFALSSVALLALWVLAALHLAANPLA